MKRNYKMDNNDILLIIITFALGIGATFLGLWAWHKYQSKKNSGGNSTQIDMIRRERLNKLANSSDNQCTGTLVGQGYIIDGEETGPLKSPNQIYNLQATGNTVVPTTGTGCIYGQTFDGSMQAVNISYGNYGQSSMGGSFNIQGPYIPALDTENPMEPDAVSVLFYQN